MLLIEMIESLVYKRTDKSNLLTYLEKISPQLIAESIYPDYIIERVVDAVGYVLEHINEHGIPTDLIEIFEGTKTAQ